MITDSFDTRSEAIISPQSFYGEQQHICDIAIGTFSREIYAAVLDRFPNEVAAQIEAANRIGPIHLLDVDGQKVLFYLSEIGSALAATVMIEINWKTGADKFILFGSAGSLDRELTAGKYVIPTEAYRDEGMSYHYAPPADYISIKNSDIVAQIFAAKGLPHVKGKVWTTDAIYRETRDHVAARKAEGCIAVEMELAGVQAVCNFHSIELYDFLVTGDVVDQPDYTADGLYEANHDLDKFYAALEIVKRLRCEPFLRAPLQTNEP